MITKLARYLLRREIEDYERYLSYALYYLKKNNIKPSLQRRIEQMTYEQSPLTAGILFPEEIAEAAITANSLTVKNINAR
jgi:hypothetical protein